MTSEIFSVWFLMGAALVFWMQAGFAMVETGFTRAKNAGNILMKNLMDFCIGTGVFILIGFSFLLGEDLLGFIGKPGFDIFTNYANFDWSYSTLCSAPRPRPSFPAQWQNAQSSFPTAFTPVLSPLWYTPSKHTGSGAVAGFRSSASMILQAPAPSTW